jgi:GNAT superfamily N-acetyltransferase
MRFPNKHAIRPAIGEDAAPISAIIRKTAHHFTVQLCRRELEAYLLGFAPDSIRRRITSPRYVYVVSEYGNGRGISGVAGLKDCSHLLHFFVAPEFQRQGIGRELWEAVKSQALLFGNTRGFTVNATSFAVPVYERFGFRAGGDRIIAGSIAYTPMRLVLTNATGGGISSGENLPDRDPFR